MVSLNKFIEGCKQNAARIKTYKWGKSGQNGESDCIGYPIGALDLVGQKWGGTHGCNYAVRYRMNNFHPITSLSQLKLGEFVFKVRKPGEDKYALPSKYNSSGDLNDYYHVGVVTSVNPVVISHCSTGGMHYDKTLGKWKYAGYCSLVNYGTKTESSSSTTESKETASVGKMVVDVPDDTSVNVRSKASISSNILTRLPEGSVVNVTSVSGDWSHINYNYEKSGTGYVMSKFIQNGVVDVPDDSSVNVRRQASISAARITTLPEGTAVKIISTVGAWSKVEYSFQHGGTGYVMSKYLKKG